MRALYPCRIKGPFKYLNYRFPYPFIKLNLWSPYPFIYLKPEKSNLLRWNLPVKAMLGSPPTPGEWAQTTNLFPNKIWWRTKLFLMTMASSSTILVNRAEKKTRDVRLIYIFDKIGKNSVSAFRISNVFIFQFFFSHLNTFSFVNIWY